MVIEVESFGNVFQTAKKRRQTTTDKRGQPKRWEHKRTGKEKLGHVKQTSESRKWVG